jgi:energy-coupling factor transport system ATP-binding protein
MADTLQDASGLTVTTGDNGTGKSTLLRAVAARRGDLGRVGGTAMIGQRPDAQVIGARVVDDLRWGLDPTPPGSEVDAVLARVGLGAHGERETSSLSGGELQRLALAAALLRRPALVLSDESTAMIDPEGRRQLIGLFRKLADEGVAVVHATHLDAEVAIADHRVEL